jgi:hypothetical protein
MREHGGKTFVHKIRRIAAGRNHVSRRFPAFFVDVPAKSALLDPAPVR